MLVEPTKSWIIAVENAVNNLQKKYTFQTGMLLTEGDLVGYLFRELKEQGEISGYHKSKDGFLTSFIHSEVTWFKPDTQSGYEVDLFVCDPKNLEINKIEIFENHPHKGFAHDGPCIAIEAKFIRDNSNVRDLAQKDILKLKNDLIPHKYINIESNKYKIAKKENVAFISLIGCKNKSVFDSAKKTCW